MKLLTLVAIAGMFAMSCVPVQAQAKEHANKEHGNKMKVTGCLTKGTQPDEFRITENGMTYDLYPTGKVDLSAHVGHKVEVTGTAPNADQATSTSANRTTGERIDVKSVKHISKTCQ